MKIAILSPFYPYRGGIAQFSAMLYKTLENSHEVKAFSFSRLYPDILFPGKTQFVESGDNAIAINAQRMLDSIGPFSYFRTAKAIEKFQPDVLVIAYWMPFFAPAYAHIAKRLKKKTRVITLLHNALPHEPKFFDKPLAKLLFNHSHQFIVMSETVKNDLLSLKPDADFILQPHPLYNHFGEKISSKEAKERLKIDSDRKTLLFFGLIRDYKGLDLLIDAMQHLDDSCQLVIAGESYGAFDKYEKQINQSPAKNRIRVFNRYIDDKRVPLFFSAADALILPYKSATQSGVTPVAYHFEVPIVATDVGNFRETIEQAGTGIICPLDEKSLAEGIQKLFQEDRETFVTRIREAKKALSWESFAQAVTEFSKIS